MSLTWETPFSDYFQKNVVSVTREFNGSSEILFEDKDIGTASSFILDLDFIRTDESYVFNLYSEDVFGNSSEVITRTFDAQQVISQPRPTPPNGQSIISDRGSALLSWEKSVIQEINGYRIWRANLKSFLTPDDYSIITTVDRDTDSFIDYSVESSQEYTYFITSLDVFDQESFNPIDDLFIGYQPLNITISSVSPLGIVEINSITSQGSDAVISWDPTPGAFDGYEVWRSDADVNDFNKVAVLGPSVTSYTDENSLLVNESSYYYIVRRFQNEADVFITESNITPNGSILIGEVKRSGGVTSIDQSGRNLLKLLEDPIRDETRRQLSLHRHKAWR